MVCEIKGLQEGIAKNSMKETTLNEYLKSQTRGSKQWPQPGGHVLCQDGTSKLIGYDYSSQLVDTLSVSALLSG